MKLQHGFTLTELMIVIAIGAILAALAVPSFRNMIQDSRVTSATNSFIAHLALARSEAIARRTGVVLCRSADPNALTPVCGGGTVNSWTDGWLLFVNVGNETPPTYDGGVGTAGVDILLKIGEPLTGNLQLISNANGNTHIEFNLDGTSTIPIGNDASFALCDDRNPPEDFGRQIDIDELGRAELTKASANTPLTSCTAP